MKPRTRAATSEPHLPRSATWGEWERGREARRELSRQVSGGKTLRRQKGKPRKDRLLRRLNAGERGLPFHPGKSLPPPARKKISKI